MWKKTLLGLLLADDELDVVQQECVGVAISSAELLGLALPNGPYVLVGKLLGGGIDQRKASGCNVVADGVKKVSFAQAYSGVYE